MIPILMLCLGYASMMKAANTDISALDNVIYVEPFSAMQGTQVQMSIKMKNSAAIRGFQFDLYLPDGVTVAKSAKGKILASLTEARLPDEDEHTLTPSEQDDGSIRFLCGSMADETFTGTDGEIATLTINIDGGVANGDYPIYMRTMKLTETDISKYYETDEIETTLTIGAAGYTVLDETSTAAPEAAEGVNVRVKRAIKAGKWSTICLPFAIPAEKMTAAFGEGVEVKDFTGCTYDSDNDKLTISFATVTAMEANHPYLIKVANAITYDDGFTVEGVDIVVEDNPSVDCDEKSVKVGKNTYYFYNSFVGTYVANTTVPDLCLFISNDKFYYSKGQTTMKGFRGYFDFYDVLSSVENANARVFICDETTGISSALMSNGKMNDDYYDLQGRKVKTPRKGLYIINNKKVVVK